MALSEALFGLLGINWLCIIVWGLVGGFFICVIKYMAGRVLQEEKMKVEAIAEMLDMATVLVIIFMITILESAGTNFIMNGFNIQGYSTIQDFLISNLDDSYAQLKTAEASAMSKLRENTEDYMAANGLTLMGMPILKWAMFNDQYYVKMAKFDYIARTSIQLMYWVDASMMLINMMGNIAPLALAVGFFFRAFKYTKGFGGFLIALAISIYYVYPIVFFSLFNSFGSPDITSQKVQLNGCGYNVITLSNPITLSGSSTGGNLGSQFQSSLSDISAMTLSDFVNQVYLNMFITHSIALGVTLMFLYHATLILGSGMLTNEFEGRLTKMM
jgi:hypothetical protein